MQEIDFITAVHTATKRNYLARVTEHDKAACAELAGRFDRDYWDGERHTGYGGYRYDGRWRPIAQRIALHYGLRAGDRVLDVGCGKGFLLYELTQAVPGLVVRGLDISRYALEHAKPEVVEHLEQGDAARLPYAEGSFDLVLSINTLHNLHLPELAAALSEMQRVGRRHRYLTVEAYRNEREKVNLMYWQLTCHAFHTPRAWRWLFERAGYHGDYGFIYFE